MDHHIDIEAQNLPSLPPEVGTSEMHEIGIHRPQAQREHDADQEPPVPANPSISFDVQQLGSQLEQLPLPMKSSGSGIQEADVQHSENERGSTSRHAATSTRDEQSETQPEAEIRIPHQQFGKLLIMQYGFCN